MTEERDEILDELRALISIEPAPGFEMRVRRAVRPETSLGLWWSLVAGVAVFAVVLAVRELPEVDPGVRDVAGVVTRTPAVPAPQREERVPIPRVERQRAGRVMGRRVATRPSAAGVLVPRENSRGFALLVSAARRGEIPNLLNAGEAVETPLATAPVPIEISPVEIPLVVGPAGGEGL